MISLLCVRLNLAGFMGVVVVVVAVIVLCVHVNNIPAAAFIDWLGCAVTDKIYWETGRSVLE